MWPRAENRPASRSPDSSALVSSLAALSSFPSRWRDTALDSVRLTRFCCRSSLIDVTPGGIDCEPVSNDVRNSIYPPSGVEKFSRVAGSRIDRAPPQLRPVRDRLKPEASRVAADHPEAGSE